VRQRLASSLSVALKSTEPNDSPTTVTLLPPEIAVFAAPKETDGASNERSAV